jgi:hypothetical protein
VDKVRAVVLVILVLLMLGGWICSTVLFIRSAESASRVADVEATNKKLSDENRGLRETVGRFESERPAIYRQFEEAIGGAKGYTLDALATVDRLLELSKEIGN